MVDKTIALSPRNDLNSSNSGCARLGSEVAPPLGVVIEEVAVLIVLVRAVDDEAPGAVEKEAGPAAVRRVPPGFFNARNQLSSFTKAVP